MNKGDSIKIPGLHSPMRRQLIATAAAAMLLGVTGAQAAGGATEWGWPTPYEKVSDKSVKWLKDKGWWPIQVAFQAPWSGQNTVNIVMDRMGLLKQRGVDANWTAFASGPAINEVLISGRYQVGNGGNFPFTTLVDRKIPVKAIAMVSPNLMHALVVPKDSPVKSIKDLKGMNPPAVIGLVTGSSAEFYIQMAAQVNGLEIGKDLILKNMPPGEQMSLPRGITGVVSWDPGPAMMVDERKTGRIVDSIFPYNIYEGQFYLRDELIENVPDVVQAFSDAFAEATLWIRLNPEKAVTLMAEDPNLKNYSKEILLQQVKAYNILYKPTHIFPHGEFYGKVCEPIYKWLYPAKRTTRPLSAADFTAAVDERFMRKTFGKLGWAIPKQPPFLPPGWSGKPDQPPYPDYITVLNAKDPQPFPEAGDLTASWTFGGRTYQP
jgi:ABC-type nitrate/sulfonate/bicarbonate transport system substrate-binding protein